MNIVILMELELASDFQSYPNFQVIEAGGC